MDRDCSVPGHKRDPIHERLIGRIQMLPLFAWNGFRKQDPGVQAARPVGISH
jgi:hypothetical protein